MSKARGREVRALPQQRGAAVDGDTLEDLILDVAAEQFGRNGFAETSVRAIAQAAGCSTGAVYHHFEGKTQILLRLYDRVLDIEVGAARAVASLPADEVITSLIDVMLRVVRDYRAMVSVIFRSVEALGDLERRYVQERRNEFFNELATAIERGVDDGTFADSLDARRAAWGVMGMCLWSYNWRSESESDADLDRTIQSFQQFVMRGLGG